MWVACSGNIALRLVHHDVYLVLALESFAVETDVVSVDVHLCSKLCHNLSVDCHYTCEDEVVGLSSRAYARVCDELVEANLLHDRSCHHVVVRILVSGKLRTSADHLVDATLILVAEIVEILLVEALLGSERSSLSAESFPVSTE